MSILLTVGGEIALTEQGFSYVDSRTYVFVAILLIVAFLCLLFGIFAGVDEKDGVLASLGVGGFALMLLLAISIMSLTGTYHETYRTYVGATDEEAVNSLKIEYKGNCNFTILNESEKITTLIFYREQLSLSLDEDTKNLLPESKRNKKLESHLKVDGEFEKKVKILPKDKVLIDARDIVMETRRGGLRTINHPESTSFPRCHSLLDSEMK